MRKKDLRAVNALRLTRAETVLADANAEAVICLGIGVEDGKFHFLIMQDSAETMDRNLLVRLLIGCAEKLHTPRGMEDEPPEKT